MKDSRMLFAAVVLGIVSGLPGQPASASTLNTDPRFPRWPQPGAISYCIGAGYSAVDQTSIEGAASVMTSDTGNGLHLTRVDCSSAVWKIRFTPFVSEGQAATYSWSPYPGYAQQVLKKTDPAATDQPVYLVREQGTGRMTRAALRVFSNALGLLNEHQRADRDTYIAVHPQSIVVPAAYQKYSASATRATSFDYCSVTLEEQTAYAARGQKAFDIPAGNSVNPGSRLSVEDVKALVLMYSLSGVSVPSASPCVAPPGGEVPSPPPPLP